MKSRKQRIFTLATFFVLTMIMAFQMGIKVGAADNEPGSVGDPLVSKSYLDSRLDEVNGVMAKVTLSKGAVLTASEGAMMILFSGNGNVSGSGAGLVNVTTGEITASKMSLAKYNTYLFPDSATTVTASSTMVVFVTGTYKVSQ